MFHCGKTFLSRCVYHVVFHMKVGIDQGGVRVSNLKLSKEGLESFKSFESLPKIIPMIPYDPFMIKVGEKEGKANSP